MNRNANIRYREYLRFTEVQLWVEQCELRNLSESALPAIRKYIETEIGRLERQVALQREQIEALTSEPRADEDGAGDSGHAESGPAPR